MKLPAWLSVILAFFNYKRPPCSICEGSGKAYYLSLDGSIVDEVKPCIICSGTGKRP